MRIVAGTLKGRRIAAPKGEATRPTADRVREALFSSLASLPGAPLAGGVALDPFAGSGALGFEALSRGVDRITFVDRDRGAIATLRANAEALGVLDRVHIVQGDSGMAASKGAIAGGPFTLLLLDPPYRLDASAIGRLVAELGAHDLLEPGAVVVYEHAEGVTVRWPEDVRPVSAKRYGSTEIDIATYGKGTESL